VGPDPRDDHRPGHPRFAGKPFDDSRDPAHQPDSWLVAGAKAVAGLLTALFLTPTIFRYISLERHRPGVEDPVMTKRGASRRADPHSCEPH
jgi:hypothetical protein